MPTHPKPSCSLVGRLLNLNPLQCHIVDGAFLNFLPPVLHRALEGEKKGRLLRKLRTGEELYTGLKQKKKRSNNFPPAALSPEANVKTKCQFNRGIDILRGPRIKNPGDKSETQPQCADKLVKRDLKCSKTSGPYSPTPTTAGCQASLTALSLLPVLFPIHLFQRVPGPLKSGLDCFPDAQKSGDKSQIGQGLFFKNKLIRNKTIRINSVPP